MKAQDEPGMEMISANPNEKLHASAPVGHRCADCQIDAEACPHCYRVWWQRRHPNVQQVSDLAAVEDERDRLKADIAKFWDYVDHGYDIEPRAYFEKEARTNGFDSPLAQAAHHIWKRDPKVHALQASLALLTEGIAQVIAEMETQEPASRGYWHSRLTDLLARLTHT